jgi:hypothetical protein
MEPFDVPLGRPGLFEAAEMFPDNTNTRATENIFKKNVGIDKKPHPPRHSRALCWRSTEEYLVPGSARVHSAAHMNVLGDLFFERFTRSSIE